MRKGIGLIVGLAALAVLPAMASSVCGNGSGPCARISQGADCEIGTARGICRAILPTVSTSDCACEIRIYDRERTREQLVAGRVAPVRLRARATRTR